MGLSRRIRNIAISQLNALKERLDRVDLEAEEEVAGRRAESDARSELNDPSDRRLLRRTPEEIAAGVPGANARTQATPPSANPLAVHYRILGVEEGADLSAVNAAYQSLIARCDPKRFPEGSEEQKAAAEIFKRVESAYDALRDALDPTAGRFDKLEL